MLRLLRTLARVVGITLAVLLLVCAGAVWWVGQTTSFVRWALDRAVAASDGALEAGAVQGSLAGGFRIASLHWRDASRQVQLRDLGVQWRPTDLLRRQLRFTRIEIGSVELRMQPSDEPAALPPSLRLPVALRIDALGIGRLNVVTATGDEVLLEKVALAARHRIGSWRIEHLSAVSPRWGEASLRGLLGDQAPYALEASAWLRPRLEGRPALPPVSVLADGTLEEMAVAAVVSAPGAGSAGVAGGAGRGALPGLPPGRAPGASPGTAPDHSPSSSGAPPVWIGADTRVRPFAADPLGPIELTLNGVEPAQLGFDQLHARISGAATLNWNDGRLRGRLRLANATPGPLDQQALPLQSIESAFEWAQQQLSLSGLRVSGSGAGTISGDGSVDFGQLQTLFGQSLPTLRARLRVADVDLSRWAASLARTQLRGDVAADGTAFTIDLADASRAGIALAAQAALDGEVLRATRAQLRTPGGQLSFKGSVGLQAPYQVDVAGDFSELDPAAAYRLQALLGLAAATDEPVWLPRLQGRLSGNWAASGCAWPQPQLTTRLGSVRGTLDGQSLRLDWRGDVSLQRIDRVDLDLSHGDVALAASGSFGQAGDRLQFRARAGDLARFDARLGGAVTASGQLLGGWADLPAAAAAAGVPGMPGVSGTPSAAPSAAAVPFGIVAEFAARRLRWADQPASKAPPLAQAEAVSGRIDVPDLRVGRLDLRLEASAVQAGEQRLDRLQAQAEGTLAAHTLRVSLAGPSLTGEAAARGGLLDTTPANWRWEGTLQTLRSEQLLPVQLKAPARLALSAAAITVEGAELDVDGGQLRIEQATFSGGRIDTRGSATALPVARWAERFGKIDKLSRNGARLDDAKLDARWQLAGSAWQTMSGTVSLALDAGETIDSRGRAQLALDEGRLDGSVDLRIPSLAFANRLIGPEWAVAGRLRFDGRVGGTLQQPRLNGDLRGSDLTLLQRAMGWRLADGALDARFEGDRLDVRQLRLVSGQGSIAMSGHLLLDGLLGQFQLKLDRLPVPIGPGQRVVLSGDSTIDSKGMQAQWTGRIRADEGLIELRGGDAPKLASDIVIIDRNKPAANAGSGAGSAATGSPAANSSAPADAASRTASASNGADADGGLRIGADLTLDLGEKLRVRGSGVDVTLAGTLNLRGTLPAEPRAYGTVSVRRGSYSAYGQQLEITRGQVLFNGALDNPVLDIVAMRRNQAVEAGVALSGTVLSPRVRLVSNPDVSDSQKLSWLVLGVGLDDVRSGSQMAALQAAAATLFGSNDGGLTGGLASTLGLDMLTVRNASTGGVFDPNFGATFPGQAGTSTVTSDTVSQNVVAIGKRLSSRVFVTYEQGLRGVWSLLRIQYDITNRLSVRAQTGTDTAVDMLYFYSFD
ncbi:MAG: translocation/assembly module TamB domain-containing protein [Burkholderiales bacterium]|nr:translocation/assembly module TamB domain-containing protein [Burkholderiales bacterium]